MALNFQREQLKVVSIGVGVYPEPPKYWHKWVISKFFLVRLLQKTLNINTRSMEKLSTILFKDVSMVRINDHYSRGEFNCRIYGQLLVRFYRQNSHQMT